MRRVAVVGALAGVAACGGDPAPIEGMRPTKPRECYPAAPVTGFPETVEDVVALINSFPKPVTLPCLLESLDRPLELTASSNAASAQPALGPNNPRIFIFRGDLSLAVVPKGDGRELLELGLRRDELSTVKAEIHFPVLADVELAAPYERVRYGSGTNCGFCHLDESRDDIIDFAEAFRSRLIAPALKNTVDLEYLVWSFEECDPLLEPDRCDMFDSIFAQGEVSTAAFD